MINQITLIRLPNGDEVALVDWSARPLYSTVDLLTTFTDEEIRAFNYAEGDSVSATSNFAAAAIRVASLRDTNISGRSEMDSTEEFLVYGIKVEMHQFTLSGSTFVTTTTLGTPVPNAPTMSLLHNRLILELEASDKAFPQAGLGWFPAGFGPQIAVTSTAAVRTFANNGLPSHQATDVMPIPCHIGGTEDYSVIIHNPPGGPAQTGDGAVTFLDDAAGALANAIIQLRIYLWGLQKRATA